MTPQPESIIADKPKPHHRKMNEGDRNYIMLNYTRMTALQMSKHLGFSKGAVCECLQKRGLKAYMNKSRLSLSEKAMGPANTSDFTVEINGQWLDTIRNNGRVSDYNMILSIHRKHQKELSNSRYYKIYKVIPSRFPAITEADLIDINKPIMVVVEPSKVYIEPQPTIKRAAAAIYSNRSAMGIAK